MSYEGNLKGTYTYSGLHQLISRVVTNSGSLDGTRAPIVEAPERSSRFGVNRQRKQKRKR